MPNITQVHVSNNRSEEDFSENPYIHWEAILWVDRSFTLWIIQVVLAVISLTETLILLYLGYKVSVTILHLAHNWGIYVSGEYLAASAFFSFYNGDGEHNSFRYYGKSLNMALINFRLLDLPSH